MFRKKQKQTSYPIAAPPRAVEATSQSAEQGDFEKKKELWARIQNAFGPIIGGLIIDLFDLATFGPIGIFIGLVVGGVAGYWVGSMYNLSSKYRWLLSAIAGVYCTIPTTGLLPFATITSAFIRFFDHKPEKKLPPAD